MTLAKGQAMAEKIVAELAPLCWAERCMIAGSIRRQRPEVEDIDLVCIPKDMEEFRKRVLRRAEIVIDGPVNLIVRLGNGVQLDIFMARRESRDLFETRPTNWGSLLLCRTGSKEHNIELCTRAGEMGYKWEVYKGLVDKVTKRIIASETEPEIFDALNMAYVEPVDREAVVVSGK